MQNCYWCNQRIESNPTEITSAAGNQWWAHSYHLELIHQAEKWDKLGFILLLILTLTIGVMAFFMPIAVPMLVVTMGLLLLSLPMATPQVKGFCGVRKAITLTRGIAVAVIVLGLILVFL
ncbi:MAG: hypothetical protein CMP10_21870 [Zetaproteobacteria bacterium]|nr:hypothetical protein [Pseudobdellovibrionaceae bacterium]